MFRKIDLSAFIPDETPLLQPYADFVDEFSIGIRLEPVMTDLGAQFRVLLMGRDGCERAIPSNMSVDERVPEEFRAARALRHAQQCLLTAIDQDLVAMEQSGRYEITAAMERKHMIFNAIHQALPDLGAMDRFIDDLGSAPDFVWLASWNPRAPQRANLH